MNMLTRFTVGPLSIEETSTAYTVYLLERPLDPLTVIVKPSSGSLSLVHTLIQEIKLYRDTRETVQTALSKASAYIAAAHDLASLGEEGGAK